jgi:hypothetical protein
VKKENAEAKNKDPEGAGACREGKKDTISKRC